MEKSFPDHMTPLEKNLFQFSCHSGLECFTQCCKNVDMFLYPYDIVRLKNAVGMQSDNFLSTYTSIVKGHNPYFPSVMMKMNNDNACPFLCNRGCTIYRDRPSSCRTYPLERAVDRESHEGRLNEFYFLTKHPYCLGHEQGNYFSTKDWIRSQRIEEFNLMNDYWAEVDSIFMANPWRGDESGGSLQQLAFMACYNIDSFRSYVEKNKIIEQFRLPREVKKSLRCDDKEMMKFGFQWLILVLTGKSNLVRR